LSLAKQEGEEAPRVSEYDFEYHVYRDPK